MASITAVVMVPVVWAKDQNHLLSLKGFALWSALSGLMTKWYIWKWSRIVLLTITWTDLAISNAGGIGQVSPCLRKARERDVGVANGVCKLQAGLAGVMIVHLVLSIGFFFIWRDGEHPTRGIVRALRTGRARKEQTVAVGSPWTPSWGHWESWS